MKRHVILLGTIASAWICGHALAQDVTKIKIAGPAPVLSVTDSVIWYAIPVQMGYYKEEGLDVSYNLSPGLTGAAQAMQTGSVQFAVTNPEVVMQVREQGGNLIAFQTLRRSNGNSVAVLPDSSVKTLADLKGKTLGGVSWGGGGALYLTKVLGDMGIGMADYNRVVTGNGAAAAAALRARQVDAVVLWDSAYAGLENTGLTLRYIPIPDQEKLGSNTFVTSDAYMKANESIVARFCRAVAKSYYFARISQEAAVRAFMEANPTFRPANVPAADAARDYLHVFKAYLNGATAGAPLDARIGEIDAATWAFNQNFYKNTGLLKGLQPPEASFTNRFTDGCNGFDRAKVAESAKAYAAAAK